MYIMINIRIISLKINKDQLNVLSKISLSIIIDCGQEVANPLRWTVHID